MAQKKRSETHVPTEYLILELLAARHRLGEEFWTFPAWGTFRKALRSLERQRLVGWKSGTAQNTFVARLTPFGRLAVLNPEYAPPTPPEDLAEQETAVEP